MLPHSLPVRGAGAAIQEGISNPTRAGLAVRLLAWALWDLTLCTWDVSLLILRLS